MPFKKLKTINGGCMREYISIIGGGLAGCEAAYQIAKRGIKV